MKIKVLRTSDGYEGVYIDGILHDYSDSFSQDPLYFLKLTEIIADAKKTIVKSEDFKFCDFSEEDDEEVQSSGDWPCTLNDLISSY